MKVAINVFVATVLFAATLVAAGGYIKPNGAMYGDCSGTANATWNVIARSVPKMVSERFAGYSVNVRINFHRKCSISQRRPILQKFHHYFLLSNNKKLIFKLCIRSYRLHITFVASNMSITKHFQPISIWQKVASVGNPSKFKWNHNLAMESIQLFIIIHINVYISNSWRLEWQKVWE